MEAPIYTIMNHVHNFFPKTKETGTFEIKGGTIKVKKTYLPGQYVRLKGSILNDSVYRIESVTDGMLDFNQSDTEYPKWTQPKGAQDAYSAGDKVTHEGIRYISRIDANVYVPGTDARWWEPVPGVELESALTDETFTGEIYGLAVPVSFLSLVREIVEFEAKRAQDDPTLQSESFMNYSYIKATDGNGGAATWQSSFAGRLSDYYCAWEKQI